MSAVRHVTKEILDRAVELREKEGLQWTVIHIRLGVTKAALDFAIRRDHPELIKRRKK